jgi:Ca2+-binding EF-hand superfamily protein
MSADGVPPEEDPLPAPEEEVASPHKITSLPSLPYASQAVVEFLGPPNEHFTKFGLMREEGAKEHRFEEFYPKKEPLRRQSTVDIKLDPFSGMVGRKVKQPKKKERPVQMEPVPYAEPTHNLYHVNKAFAAVIRDGYISRAGFQQIVEGCGVYDATPYVDHILDLFEERSDRLIIAREVMDALNVTLNDPGASAKSHMVLFNLFDEHKCSYILKWRLLELRAKRREDNGQTHLMIKALLALIDRLEKEADEAAAASGGRKKKAKSLPPIQKCVHKMQISFEEFSKALLEDPAFVICFLPPLLLCVKGRPGSA